MSARFVLVALALFAGACSGYEGGGDVRIVPLDEAASQDGGAPVADAGQGATDAQVDARTDAGTAMGSLVAYYPFDGDTRDRSPAGRDLDPVSTAFETSGHVGQALVVGQQGYIAKRASAESAFALTSGDFTVQAWVSVLNNQVGVGTRPVGAQSGWRLAATVSSVVVMTPDVANPSLSTSLPQSSAWRHAVLRRSGGTLELFVDGSSVAKKTLPWAATGSAFAVTGTLNGGTGRIDELALWSRALSDAEIRALAQGTASPATLP